MLDMNVNNIYILLLVLILIPYSYAQESFEFTLDADTEELIIKAGSFDIVRLFITSNSTEKVHLNAYGLPDDVGKVTLFPTSARTPFNATIIISTFSDVQGNYTLKVDAIAKEITKSIEIKVNIVNNKVEYTNIEEGVEGSDTENEDISTDFVYEVSIEPNIANASVGDILTYDVMVDLITGEPEEVQLETVEVEGLEINIAPNSGIPPFTSTLDIRIVNATNEDTVIVTVVGNTEDQSQSAVTVINLSNTIKDDTPKDIMLVAALVGIPIIAFMLTKTGIIKIKRN